MGLIYVITKCFQQLQQFIKTTMNIADDIEGTMFVLQIVL